MLRQVSTRGLSGTFRCTNRRFTAGSLSSPVFPWRSSEVILDRLETPNDLSGSPDQDSMSRWQRMILVGRHFRYSWLELLLGTWKQPVAEDMGWAFQKGVAGVLSRALSIPMTTIDRGINGIQLDTTSPKIASLSEWTEENEKDAKEYTERTLETRLRSKYNTIDPKVHDVKFTFKPLSYNLEYAHVIPILTREVVAKDPFLLELYQDFQGVISSRTSYNDMVEKGEKLIERAKNGQQTYTLIVDMSVRCMERFCILDKKSGDVLQGSTKEQEVCHLVRFENTVHQERTPALGDWIISDWDDLLEGNVWHKKK